VLDPAEGLWFLRHTAVGGRHLPPTAVFITHFRRRRGPLGPFPLSGEPAESVPASPAAEPTPPVSVPAPAALPASAALPAPAVAPAPAAIERSAGVASEPRPAASTVFAVGSPVGSSSACPPP